MNESQMSIDYERRMGRIRAARLGAVTRRNRATMRAKMALQQKLDAAIHAPSAEAKERVDEDAHRMNIMFHVRAESGRFPRTFVADLKRKY